MARNAELKLDPVVAAVFWQGLHSLPTTPRCGFCQRKMERIYADGRHVGYVCADRFCEGEQAFCLLAKRGEAA